MAESHGPGVFVGFSNHLSWAFYENKVVLFKENPTSVAAAKFRTVVSHRPRYHLEDFNFKKNNTRYTSRVFGWIPFLPLLLSSVYRIPVVGNTYRQNWRQNDTYIPFIYRLCPRLRCYWRFWKSRKCWFILYSHNNRIPRDKIFINTRILPYFRVHCVVRKCLSVYIMRITSESE